LRELRLKKRCVLVATQLMPLHCEERPCIQPLIHEDATHSSLLIASQDGCRDRCGATIRRQKRRVKIQDPSRNRAQHFSRNDLPKICEQAHGYIEGTDRLLRGGGAESFNFKEWQIALPRP
jgi:hypothetical protein